MAYETSAIFDGATFDSFADFSSAKKHYEDKEFCVFAIGSSKTVAIANTHAANQPDRRLYDEKLKYRTAKYICKHGGRWRGESKGSQPNQKTYKTGCKASFVIRINARSELQVCNVIEDHNHVRDATIYAQYPEVRRLLLDEKPKTLIPSDSDVGLNGNSECDMKELESLVDEEEECYFSNEEATLTTEAILSQLLGSDNYLRWQEMRSAAKFESDWSFVKWLLDLGQRHIDDTNSIESKGLSDCINNDMEDDDTSGRNKEIHHASKNMGSSKKATDKVLEKMKEDVSKSVRKHPGELSRNRQNMRSCNDTPGIKENRFVCKVCSREFNRKDGLKCHYEAMHTARQYTCICEQCGVRCYNKRQLRNHVVKHAHKESTEREHELTYDVICSGIKDNRFVCKVCSCEFNRKDGLKCHYDAMHTARQYTYICEQCGVRCYTSTNLSSHVKHVHKESTEKPHACDICQKKYFTN